MNANGLIHVVIVDDHAVSRKGIISLLEKNKRIKVVAEGCAGNDVLELVEKYRPNVLITDLQMPAHSNNPKGPLFEPVSTLQKVVYKYKETSVMIISQESNVQTIQSLAEIGVNGYLLKTDDFTTILDQIVEIISVREGSYFSTEVKEVIFTAPKLKNDVQLTERQLDILKAIVRSPHTPRIKLAETLHISPNTLQKHITAMFGALGVPNMESCILKAMRMRLISGHDVFSL